MIRAMLPVLVLLLLSRGGGDDAFTRLARDLERVRAQKVVMQGELASTMKAEIADVRLTWSVDPSRAVEAARLLLDVMGTFLDASREPTRPTFESGLRDAASEAVLAHFDPPFARWMASEVLSVARGQPLERRLAVLAILRDKSVPSTKLALLEATRDGDARVRSAALEALVGWEDDAVHAVFLAELVSAARDALRGTVLLAERHFSSVRFGERSRFAAPYAALVARDLVSDDWRAATRAIALSAPLDNERAVPCLIEALDAWGRRVDAGLGGLRIRLELQRALRDRSGRQLGVVADEWRSWWRLVKSGAIKTGGLGNQGAGGESTEASFFGIRPKSDRIAFVIDRSGSMAIPFDRATTGAGERAHRRWDEAKKQLVAILEALGPKTRFDVVLFHDFAEPWKDALTPASKDNLRALREWLDFHKPNGGTQLRAGVERALHAGPSGQLDLARLEADTVVILCDGETAEGPGWVQAFLETVNAEARVVFHGVQVGGQGDETMSRLARGSRGDFVRVGG